MGKIAKFFSRLFGGKGDETTTSKPDWKMDLDKPFLSDSLDNYNDPLLMLKLSYIYDIVPERMRRKVVVAGGFACHLAGITNTHDDVDLFCLDSEVFRALADKVILNVDGLFTRREPFDNDSRCRFSYEGFDFDLVDASETSPRTTKNILRLFDFNWAMVGIDLHNRQIVCHPGALSSVPQANKSRVDIHLSNTIKRLAKYKERLVREYDVDAYECLMSGLKTRQTFTRPRQPSYLDGY